MLYLEIKAHTYFKNIRAFNLINKILKTLYHDENNYTHCDS